MTEKQSPDEQSSLKARTAHGMMWGGLSNALTQLLNLAFGIVLARQLSAADYGMVGMLAVFTAVAGTLQEGGFISALANRKKVSHEDYNAVFWFSLGMGCAMYAVLFCCAPLIARFYGEPKLVPLARYLFLGFVLASTGVAHSAFLFRNLMVRQRTMGVLPALVISGGTGVAMACAGYAYWGIATQSIVYIGVCNAFYWHFSGFRPTLPVSFRPIREMFGFSSRLLLTNIFFQFNNNLLSTLLGRFYTPADVGCFTQSNKWNMMAHSLVSGMAGSVAQPVLASVGEDRERLRQVFSKMLGFMAFLSMPAMLGLALVSREFILITIGPRWASCVPVLQLLCIWGAVEPLKQLYTNLLLSRGRSDLYLWNTVALSLSALALALALAPFGLRAMLVGFVALNVGWTAVWQWFVRQTAGLGYKAALRCVLPFALAAGASVAAAAWLTRGTEGLWVPMMLKIVVTVALYAGLLWLSGSAMLRESLDYLGVRFGKTVKKN